MNLLIATHVPHFKDDGKIFAFAPYVQEINYFPQAFNHLSVFAPELKSFSENESYYERPTSFHVAPIRGGGNTLVKKILLILSIPSILVQIHLAFKKADILHIRCPGNIGFLSLIYYLFFNFSKKKAFAKYAGEWNNFKGESISNRIQKFLLKRSNIPVFCYTDVKVKNVVPFYTSTMTIEQIRLANKEARNKTLGDPVRILFLGRLSKNRGVHVLIKAMNELISHSNSQFQLEIYGDGEERESLEEYSKKLGIEQFINFHGWKEITSILSIVSKYHIICQPTLITESWGKTLQEGMAYGLVPIASRIGGLQSQLKERPELLFSPGDVQGLKECIRRVTSHEKVYAEYSEWAIEESRKYSLDRLNMDMNRILKDIKLI